LHFNLFTSVEVVAMAHPPTNNHQAWPSPHHLQTVLGFHLSILVMLRPSCPSSFSSRCWTRKLVHRQISIFCVDSTCFSRDQQNACKARHKDHHPSSQSPSPSSSSLSTCQAHGDWPGDLFCLPVTTSCDSASFFCLFGCCAPSSTATRCRHRCSSCFLLRLV
jgi:hypothetical protein